MTLDQSLFMTLAIQEAQKDHAARLAENKKRKVYRLFLTQYSMRGGRRLALPPR